MSNEVKVNFNYLDDYTCICGRTFKSSSSLNGHKSHCKAYLGEENWEVYQERMSKWINAGKQAGYDRQEKAAEAYLETIKKWVEEKHVCEVCGKVMTNKYGSGRFCSQICAHKVRLLDNKPKYCLYCGKELIYGQRHTKKFFCSPDCSNQYRSELRYQKYLEDNSIAWGQQNMQRYKKYFLKEQDFKCAICGISNEWHDKPLMFVLDHIDGNADNNNRDNLRLICPNCDSQLDTFKSKNKNSARAKHRNIKVVTETEYEQLQTKN